VLANLAAHHNAKTGQCDPGIDTIALETGANRKTVIAAIQSLEHLGIISSRHRRRRPTVYTLNMKSQKRDFKSRLRSP
jgi:DNA-binding transcriptional MocR family regulator